MRPIGYIISRKAKCISFTNLSSFYNGMTSIKDKKPYVMTTWENITRINVPIGSANLVLVNTLPSEEKIELHYAELVKRKNSSSEK